MNAVELIDTHAHLYLEEFADDLPAIMERAAQAGVTTVVLPGLDSAHNTSMFELERRYPGKLLAMAGIHPCYIKDSYQMEVNHLRGVLAVRQVAAIGEIGLDYYWDTTYKTEQKSAFEQQLEIAFEYNLPVVIHSRNAMDDTIAMLQAAKGTGITGIFHCFSGTLQNAADIIDCGFVLGIGGVITYKNAGLAEVVADIPMDKLVLETDAPYLSPAPFRGKRNESSYLKYIVARLAAIKGISEHEVAAMTTGNARRIFSRG
jgi:TatD DNase family protein